MKIGRNDPCHCGSGKKYKKCCLNRDEEKQREGTRVAAAASSLPSTIVDDTEKKESMPPQQPIDPKEEKLEALHNDFRFKDYEGRVAIFLNLMDESELLDSEGAFEMLGKIFEDAVKIQEYERYNGLLETFQQRHPDVYCEDEPYYLDWWISNAVALGQYDVVHEKMLEFVEHAGSSLQIFDWSMERITYHGKLATLLEVTRKAWPEIKDSQKIMDWAINEFSENAVNFEIFNLITQSPVVEFDDATLKDRVGDYIDYDQHKESVHKLIQHLTGQSNHQWVMGDFSDLQSSNSSPKNLILLSREMVGELHRDRGVDLTKAELGRGQLVRYLFERAKGELVPGRRMIDSVFNPNKSFPKQKKPIHPLCPDRNTFEKFLADSMHFMNPHIYQMVACFELIPDWLQFLVSRQLVDEATHRKVLSNLRPMIDHVHDLCAEYYVDPVIQKAIKGF